MNPRTSTPTFSILIPVYNAEATIAQAISSCLNQTRRPLEILVGDDGSTDGTFNIIQQFEPEVVVDRHPNIGQSATLNRLAGIAKGDYLVLLDADDWNAPHRLEKLGEHLSERSPEILTHDAWHIYPDGTKERHYERVRWPRENQLQELLLGNFVFGNPAIAREALRSLGGFDVSIQLGEDYDLWIRALLRGFKISICEDPLYYYRHHPSSKTSQSDAVEDLEEGILRRHLALAETQPKIKRIFAKALAQRTGPLARTWQRLNESVAIESPPARRDLLYVALHRSTNLRARSKALMSLVAPQIWLNSRSDQAGQSPTHSGWQT